MDTTPPTPQPVEPLERPESRSWKSAGKKVKKNFNTLQVLKVEYVSVTSIYPNPYNPNRQSDREFELLLKSMEEDGFTQPVVVQRKDNSIVDGEHRWRAANRLGMKELPVVFVDMTPAQMRVSTLRHNRARGSEDIELTIKMFQDLRSLGALDHAIDSLGMTEKEMNFLIDDLPAPEQMAAEEYHSAWVPSNLVEQPKIVFKKNSEVHTSEEVILQRDDLQERMVNADTFTKLGETGKDIAINFRIVSVTVSGEQARKIKEVLGTTDALPVFMKLCCQFIVDTPAAMLKLNSTTQWYGHFNKIFEKYLGYIPEDLLIIPRPGGDDGG